VQIGSVFLRSIFSILGKCYGMGYDY
jgi:hypothetical protein